MFAVCSNGMTFNAIFSLKWNFCQSVMNSTCLVTQATDSAERGENMRMKPFTDDFTVCRPNNDAFITSTAQQTKNAFLWRATRCDIRQYNDIHYVCNTCTIFVASHRRARASQKCISSNLDWISQLSTHSLRTAGCSATLHSSPHHARASLHNREGNVEDARAVQCRYGSVCLGLGIGHKNKHGCP